MKLVNILLRLIPLLGLGCLHQTLFHTQLTSDRQGQTETEKLSRIDIWTHRTGSLRFTLGNPAHALVGLLLMMSNYAKGGERKRHS